MGYMIFVHLGWKHPTARVTLLFSGSITAVGLLLIGCSTQTKDLLKQGKVALALAASLFSLSAVFMLLISVDTARDYYYDAATSATVLGDRFFSAQCQRLADGC